ncbi:hypothetical protein OSB04_020554 [Centaurea solstitialis]|uniref:Cyclin-dependent kinase inhibitor n=1 Tax=Centaurea solstitialis TaxID=347529 RepID=A0AA38T5W2_9ASTR|nr:hypothetical protein OSB04_020554 [Centaurea solstitialis]
MRKAKLTGDVVAVMEVSQPSLGVRTRAKTLALQKLQASKTASAAVPASEHGGGELSYLQLRSRRLEKPPLQQQSACQRRQNPNPNPRIEGDGEKVESQIEAGGETEGYCCDLGSEETSFGENNVDFDGRKRSTRESTPCSFIRDLNASSTPGSSTRPKTSNWVTQRSMPAAQEIEGFFARHAQEQQRRFSEKYNFDIVNEKPLEGRYEWVRVQP